MKATVFLVFNSKKVLRMTTKYLPSLDSGEYMVEVTVAVPDEFFLNPVPHFHLNVPVDHIRRGPPFEMVVEPIPEEERSEDSGD